MNQSKTNVIIIGCGPTGVVLAHLLGKAGISVRILEKDAEVFPVPRATHMDEETLRNLQMTGLMQQLEKFTSPFGSMEVRDENGKLLLQEEITQPDSVHGYVGSRFFDQPEIEKILREGLKKYPAIELLTGMEAIAVSQSEAEVTVAAKNILSGEIVEYKAAWIIGCDGGRSVTRAALNIEMTALEPSRDWLIVDTILKNKSDASLLPGTFQYLFLPERLTIFAYGFGLHRRWEFQLNKDEQVPHESVVKSWIKKFISPDKVEVTRIAKYAHNSLVAKSWRNKRILLAGDAAHMMPPSAGQGLCSGVRDAVNLAWKLEAVIKNNANEKLIETYETERKTHLNEILKRTLFIGHRMDGDSSFQRWWRKFSLQLIEHIIPLRNFFRKKYNTPPPLQNGCLDSFSALAGKHLPQAENSDDVGYRFVLITVPGKFNEHLLSKAREKSIFVLQEHIAIEKTIFPAWLSENDIDFAIVRPDKIIFASGKTSSFERSLRELEKWI